MRCKYPREKTKEKIDFLSSLTNNVEILPYRRNDVRIIEDLGAYLCEEHPEICYERVVNSYENNDFAEKIEEYFLAEAKEKNFYSNDPNIINNVAPEIVLSDQIYDLKIKERFFMALLTTGDDKNRILELIKFNFKSIKSDCSAFQVALNIVFNELEKIRYYPEKQEKYRSRLHDVSHAIYAAYCDYFVTEDSKLSYKTKAAYSYLKIDTTVTDLKGLAVIISNRG
jgi:hypothetical protein